MEKEAILHIPLSQFAFAEKEDRLVIRIRCKKDDLKRCVLYWGDRVAMEEPLPVKQSEMEHVASDMLYDYYEVKITSPYTRVCYYFRLEDDTESLYYYGRGFAEKLSCGRAEYFQFPYIRREDILDIPEWAEDIVMYHIFPDSFANDRRELKEKATRHMLLPDEKSDSNGKILPDRICKNHLGGTLKGICENLDYIEKLGINCIYLNPIFAAESYHRYDTLDYYQVDPHMGSKEDVRALVEKAHSLGIRVLLDGVFNHISSRHFLFQDVLRNGMASKYYSCFYQLPAKPKLPAPGELPEYTCFSYVASMPKTNTADPYLRQYFCDVGVYWIREFDIDGWRLDVANELDDGFLRAFRTAVKAAKPDAVIVGEVWENAAHYLNGDMMDSAMNYDFRRYCRRFFAEETVDAETFDTNVSTLLLRYRENALFAQLNLLDSHDVSRYLSLCGENVDKMELSVLLQMTFPGMPCVFYGDEKGLCGLSESEYRQAMAWGKSHPLEDIYRRLISLRKAHPALRYGDFVTNFAAGKTYSYSRNWENTRITVTMNLGGAPIPALQTGRLLLKKGGNHDIIGAWEYEVREEQIHGGDDL